MEELQEDPEFQEEIAQWDEEEAARQFELQQEWEEENLAQQEDEVDEEEAARQFELQQEWEEENLAQQEDEVDEEEAARQFELQQEWEEENLAQQEDEVDEEEAARQFELQQEWAWEMAQQEDEEDEEEAVRQFRLQQQWEEQDLAQQEEIQNLQQRLEEAEQTAEREQESLQLQLQVLQAELQQMRSTQQATVQTWMVPRSDVEIMNEIDRGAWGVVARGRFQGQVVAVKWPHPAICNEQTIERLRREVRIMAQVRHPNLLHFIAAVFNDQMPHLPPLIVMELLDTNLRTAYRNGRVLDDSKISIFQDVACALRYLHEHREPIIHRDVSAPNVLLQELPNQMWRAKVSDFGSANLARAAQTMGEGAIIYAAPETIPQVYDRNATPPPQTTKIDVYSYGVLLCEVITCQLPDPAQYQGRLRQIQRQWCELIIHCIERNPEDRPTMSQVLNRLNQLPSPSLALNRGHSY